MSKKGKWFLKCMAIVVTLLLPGVSSADDPTRIQFQGYLTDADGPVNGTVNMVFRLYPGPSLSTAIIWGEGHSNVPVSNGVYSVLLGGGSP